MISGTDIATISAPSRPAGRQKTQGGGDFRARPRAREDARKKRPEGNKKVQPDLSPVFLQETAETFYLPLFKFAHRLCGNSTDAADFTQETFYLVQTRGHQLRTRSKVKSWLFTTLYRQFLKRRHRQNRFPEVALEEADGHWHEAGEESARPADAALVLRELAAMDERYGVPLKLFYLENKSYREIAKAVPLPIGTVMSRISRGKRLLASVLSG